MGAITNGYSTFIDLGLEGTWDLVLKRSRACSCSAHYLITLVFLFIATSCFVRPPVAYADRVLLFVSESELFVIVSFVFVSEHPGLATANLAPPVFCVLGLGPDCLFLILDCSG